MEATIHLPDSVFEALRARAAQQGSSIQAVILQAVEKELGRGTQSSDDRHHVQLPLIRSRQPGSLRSLTNAEIDALLD